MRPSQGLYLRRRCKRLNPTGEPRNATPPNGAMLVWPSGGAQVAQDPGAPSLFRLSRGISNPGHGQRPGVILAALRSLVTDVFGQRGIVSVAKITTVRGLERIEQLD